MSHCFEGVANDEGRLLYLHDLWHVKTFELFVCVLLKKVGSGLCLPLASSPGPVVSGEGPSICTCVSLYELCLDSVPIAKIGCVKKGVSNYFEGVANDEGCPFCLHNPWHVKDFKLFVCVLLEKVVGLGICGEPDCTAFELGVLASMHY